MKRTLFSAITLFASLSAPAAVAQRTPDARLDTDPPGAGYSYAPRIAVSQTSAYAVWTDLRNGQPDVYLNRSVDGGSTWLATDVRVNTNAVGQATSQFPQIAAFGESVFVAYEQEGIFTSFHDVYLNRSSDRGATWLPEHLRLNTNVPGTASAFRPQIAATGRSVYVTWQDGRNGPGDDVYLNRSSDGGRTWLDQDVLVSKQGVANSESPQIAASGSHAYVAWTDWRNGPGSTDIYLNASSDGGATWFGNDVRVTTKALGVGFAERQRIAASGTSAFITWRDGRHGGRNNYNVYFSRSTDGGVTWLANDVRLNTNDPDTALCDWPQIAVSGAAVYVVWEDDRHGGGDVYFNRSLDGGATWLANDVRVSSGPAARVQLPRMVASGSSVYVTWQDQRNGASDVYFNRSADGGVTWQTEDLRLDTDPPGAARSTVTDIALTQTTVHVVWQDARNQPDPDIYYNVPFGALPYGPAKPGSAGIAPEMAVRGAPVRGATVSIDVLHALGGSGGYLWGGAGPGAKISVPLLGVTLLVQPVIAVPLVIGGTPGVPGAGSASIPLAIPAVPALLGANLNFQAALLDAGATFGVSLTDAVELWIG